MINTIIKKLIKDYENTNDPKVREKYGTTSSIVGIIANVLLSLSKIAIGIISNSISVIADGINNFSDAGSSIIVLLGFKVSGRPADKKHPFGHARAEYLTGLIFAAAILLVGIELIKSSISKILNPEVTIYSIASIVVLCISILIKLWLSRFYLVISGRISSSAVKAAATDSRNDVIATTAVLLSSLISKITGFEIDAYMGIAVALFILYSGIDILKKILNPILGEMPSKDFVDKLNDWKYNTIN